MNNNMVSIKTVAKFLDEILDAPCNYEFFNESVAEFMFKNNEDWCKKCCPSDNSYTCCWEEYLRHKLKEFDDNHTGTNIAPMFLSYSKEGLEVIKQQKESEVQYYE